MQLLFCSIRRFYSSSCSDQITMCSGSILMFLYCNITKEVKINESCCFAAQRSPRQTSCRWSSSPSRRSRRRFRRCSSRTSCGPWTTCSPSSSTWCCAHGQPRKPIAHSYTHSSSVAIQADWRCVSFARPPLWEESKRSPMIPCCFCFIDSSNSRNYMLCIQVSRRRIDQKKLFSSFINDDHFLLLIINWTSLTSALLVG